MSELYTDISSVTSVSDILTLKGDRLYTLLQEAYVEATEIEQAIRNVENANIEADKYNQIFERARMRYPQKDIIEIMGKCYHPDLYKHPGYKQFSLTNIVIIGILLPFIAIYVFLKVLPIIQASPIGSIDTASIMLKLWIIIGLAGMILIIFGIIKNNKIKKNNGQIFNQVLQNKIATANQAHAYTQKIIDSAKAIYLVPRDYRYSLALSKMLTILENKRADNWMTVADKFEDYLHKWRMEQNSNEALEYQRFIAIRANEAARAARTAATASSISAGINIARLFI